MWHLAYICCFCRHFVAVYRKLLPHQNRQATELDHRASYFAQAHDHRIASILHSATAALLRSIGYVARDLVI